MGEIVDALKACIELTATLEKTGVREFIFKGFVLEPYSGVTLHDAVHEAALFALKTGQNVYLRFKGQQCRIDPAAIVAWLVDHAELKKQMKENATEMVENEKSVFETGQVFCHEDGTCIVLVDSWVNVHDELSWSVLGIDLDRGGCVFAGTFFSNPELRELKYIGKIADILSKEIGRV